MDLKSLFDAIGTQAVAAALPKIVTPPDEPGGVYAVVRANGTVEMCEAKPSHRAHKCLSLESFAAYVSQAGSAAKDIGEALPVVWYSRSGVTAILNDGDSRRDRVSLPLELSPQLRTLQGYSVSIWHDQRAFVRLLRFDLAGCWESNQPALLDCVRRLKFTQNVAGHGTIEQTKRSTGQTIESEISGSGAFPELVTLSVPIFVAPPLRVSVQCATDTDPSKAMLQLVPLPMELEGALQLAERQLGEQLENLIGDAAEIYYGKPE